jgi:hypothetical protein
MACTPTLPVSTPTGRESISHPPTLEWKKSNEETNNQKQVNSENHKARQTHMSELLFQICLFVSVSSFFKTLCSAATQKVKECHTWPLRVRKRKGRTQERRVKKEVAHHQ